MNTHSTTAIDVKELSVRYGDYLALENISLRVVSGCFVVIIGPNGSGKSTFIKTLLGLVKPCSGSAEIYGQPVSDINPSDIGYVPQLKSLDRSFPAMALELVVSGLRGTWPAFISREEEEKAEQALAKVGAEHLAHRPLGGLSGGELQRVYLARIFARSPKLVLLDEPATGIDAVGEEDLHRLLDLYNKETGATILMVTHDWLIARHHATEVMLLNRKCMAYGPPSQSLTEENLQKAFGHVGHLHPLLPEHHHD